MPLLPPPLMTGLVPQNRFYFGNLAIPYNPPTIRGTWNDASLHTTSKLSRTPVGAATTKVVSESEATQWTMMMIKFASPALFAPVTISGTFDILMGCLEDNANADLNYRIFMYVTVGSTDVSRGTLFNANILSEFPTSPAGLLVSGNAISSVGGQTNDRLIIELGVLFNNLISTTRSATLHYGNTGGVDLGNGDANVTTRPGWINFSTALPISY